MRYQLPLVFGPVLCLAASALAQAPSAKIVPLGQLDGPQMRQISGASCGPYFTMTPTDASGGGIVHLAVAQSPTETAIVNFPVKAIHVKWCESCDTPQFSASGDESSMRADLSISRDHWKLSPCLKSAKVDKR